MSQVSERPLVIYHGGCADGQGAAAAFYTKYPNAEFVAGTYSRPAPDVNGRDVYLLDFSYPRHQIIDMCAQANSVTIIDHHESAEKDLMSLEAHNLEQCFNTGYSGAVLTWRWCWPTKDVPHGLRLIQDRDLWRFELIHTKPFNAYLYSIEFQIGAWAALLTDNEVLKAEWNSILSQGEALLRQDAKRVKDIVKHARTVVIAGYPVPAVNCNHYYASDVGHALAVDQLFAATYYDTTDGRVFSLRSSPEGLNVANIAKQLGGGGHAKAAGFKIPFSAIPDYEL